MLLFAREIGTRVAGSRDSAFVPDERRLVAVMVVAAAAISGGGERDDRRGPTAGRGGSRGGEARKLYSLNRWKGFDTASSGDDGPCSGAAFRRRGTTEWRGTVRSLLLSLSLSLGPSRVPPPVLPLARPSVARPLHAILSPSRRADMYPSMRAAP